MQQDFKKVAKDAINSLRDIDPFNIFWTSRPQADQEEMLEILEDEFSTCAEIAIYDGSPEAKASLTERAERMLQEIKDLQERHLP